MNLDEFESIKRWKAALGKRKGGMSETTWGEYTWGFQQFLNWLKMDPDEIISERIKDMTSTDFIVRGRFEDLCDKFYKEYPRKKTTASWILRVVQSFFKHNRSRLETSIPTPEPVRKNDIIPTNEQIQRMVQNENARNAAIIMVFAETGLPPDTLINLKYGDIMEEFENGTIPMKINAYRNKVKRDFVIFLCDDGVYYLRRHLIGKNLGKDDLIFQIGEAGVLNMIKEAGARIGICEPTGISGFRSYTLGRKRVQTILESVRIKIDEGPYKVDGTIPVNWVDLLLCHKPRGSQADAYSRPPEHILRSCYAQAMSQLRVF